MANNVIQVFEHETLKVGQRGFSEKHLQLLDQFRGDREDSAFGYYSLVHHGVKFKQFVGVLCVGDLQIEVLPKVERDFQNLAEEHDTSRNYLLQMLSTVYRLKVEIPSSAEQRLVHSRVLDVFLEQLLNEVEKLLHIGLIKTYRKVEGNNSSLKGRLVMSRHLTSNVVHQERFYTEYTTYDRNHVCNCILHKALQFIPDVTSNVYLQHRAKALLFEWPEVNDIAITETLFSRLSYDRKTEDYRPAMEIAKLLLLQQQPNLKSRSNKQVLALMFDMNKLWEELVFLKLRKALSPDYKVSAQEHHLFWKSDVVGRKQIIPDIVVRQGNRCVAVLDTKWKCPKDGKPSDADLKQMYVYHKFLHEPEMAASSPSTALVYPAFSDSVVEGYFCEDTAPRCSMIYLSIDNLIKERIERDTFSLV